VTTDSAILTLIAELEATIIQQRQRIAELEEVLRGSDHTE
jgi:hypothetical protein